MRILSRTKPGGAIERHFGVLYGGHRVATPACGVQMEHQFSLGHSEQLTQDKAQRAAQVRTTAAVGPGRIA